MIGLPAVARDTYWVGVNDHETDLFEALWPLPYGVSYNAYLVVDNKIALIDAVKGHFLADHLGKIRALLPAHKSLDYLIINHMEPDHTGAIDILRSVFPHMTLVGNKKTLEMLRAFYGADSACLEVGDGDELDLGTHRLQFHLTPMVHWPETMMTFDATTGVLFSGDAFGGFGAVDRGLFDDEVNLELMQREMLRYFTNIVARYGQMVIKAIEKLRPVPLRVVAPTHGTVWRRNPSLPVELYARWSAQECDPTVAVIYGSMYGNTYRLVEVAARALTERGLAPVVHDIARSHASHVVADLWTCKGLILACPTYNTGLFPPMESLLALLENKLLKNRLLGFVTSYAWAGGARKALEAFAQRLSLEVVPPVVEVKGAGTAQDLEQCALLAAHLAERISS
ncbi:FprA family A-type flavoprotein [Desulfosoma caldarium]|uniref:Flavorubredoxin n=1 Tax=Desulfosoma caldarium TaxID=610254 RepID=A0A3N1VKD0_9BACT|nr:FprA family A-type flavoprotein [Desulfosoma caldarium]ROR03266.1 flavorubredoxin [Desulfosoma caldarium]